MELMVKLPQQTSQSTKKSTKNDSSFTDIDLKHGVDVAESHL